MKIKHLFLMLLITLTFGLQAQYDKDWHHADPSEGFVGVSTDRTYDELLEGKSGEIVVVAIIDSGVDIEHEDLAPIVWVNQDEIPGNGIDDDKNGYVDDVNGWNFIGGPDGKNVGPDTYEVTRLYGKYKSKYENANPTLLNDKDRKEYENFLVYKKEVEEKRAKAEARIGEMDDARARIAAAINTISDSLAAQGLAMTPENISAMESADRNVAIGKRIANDFLSAGDTTTAEAMVGILNEAIEGDKKRYQDQLDYAYNPDFDPRSTIVKDDYSNSKERYYGNNDVEGPDALHGTHVAGIVAAVRNNDIGMNGIASNVRIMSVRTVPDGDERDKDVANAIRYAVDNGASIINMSFGKGYSWDKDVVDDAMHYAAKKDVLLVHAAGNSAQDNDVTGNFPTDKYRKKKGGLFCKKKEAKTWIEVGALSFQEEENSVATFSNYGQNNVDIFAPGVQIYATFPDNQYQAISGTSMASPVVAGVAAVLRSYFPSLKAEQVKDILLSTTTPLDIQVKKPGADEGDELVPFSSLSQTGGVVNLYNAVQKAKMTKGKKKVKKKKKGNA